MERLLAIPGTLLLCAVAQALEIPLSVEEPVGVARHRSPVSSGVCFPRGAVRPDQRFRLFDGRLDVPLQISPLVVDRDGSLRWALLDFQLNVAAKERKPLVLRSANGGARPERTLSITEDGDVVTIDTGPLSFRISAAEPFRLFRAASVGGVPVVTGGAVDLVEAGTGRRYAAGKPRRLRFEYRGPLRATLRVDGDYEPVSGAEEGRGLSPGYITRITAWAGSTALRVEHILANSQSERVAHLNVQSASLKLRHTFGGDAEARVGAGGLAATLSEGTVWLHQGKLNRYYNEPIADATRAGIGEETRWTGADSAGWVAVGKGARALFVSDRDFLGDPPRRLEADERHVTVEFASSKFRGGRGAPFASDHLWLYDLSHKVVDLWIDFAASGDLDGLAQAARARLMAFASGDWYADCDVLGVGRFGTLEDEKKTYRKWGWRFDAGQVPRSPPAPHAFVRWEDNHYESEADSAEALLLMAIRTGQRGFFDRGEAWARYHANLHAWRSDGWIYDDGAIWFPQGGPLGTRPQRKPASRSYQKWGKGTGDDKELWHLVQGKACYCHFYGAGLVDHFFLTGSRDSLEAARDLAEQKNSEFRKHRRLMPGASTIHDTRGFGRGFYVVAHLLEAMPGDAFLEDLAKLCRDVLWGDPEMDERGFAPCHIGTGFGGFDPKRHIPPEMKAFMEREGIVMDAKGWLSDRAGERWPVVCLGGTWQHAYVAAAACRYAGIFGDEDMADFAEAFGRFAAKFLLAEKCHQTHYYAYMDVPIKGQAWDPWKFQAAHIATKDGEGCEHSGWYTRFFPDAITAAYTLSGEAALLHRAREFWHYGSKRGYRTKGLSAGWDAVGRFANHLPPKDDSVLSTSRMFYEWSHPRRDSEPPEAVEDLEVSRMEGGKALVRFTAPSDAGGGRVTRYQVKCADLPIVAYGDYDFARHDGSKRNMWRAANLRGEPVPRPPGETEEFVVSGAPEREWLYFTLASYDESRNRSELSNVVRSELSRKPAREGSP